MDDDKADQSDTDQQGDHHDQSFGKINKHRY
jgi:hypothetical protein